MNKNKSGLAALLIGLALLAGAWLLLKLIPDPDASHWRVVPFLALGVLIDVLRNEWGFKGVNLTDSSKDAADYVHTAECVAFGTDMFNNDTDRRQELIQLARQDGYILTKMKEVNRHYYYAYSRSNLVNGIQVGVEVPDFVPWWQTALTAINVIFGIFAGVSVVAFAAGCVLKMKKGGKE